MGNTFNIYDMELHTELNFNTFKIFRVPGGWLYAQTYFQNTCSVFVPFNNEFQKSID